MDDSQSTFKSAETVFFRPAFGVEDVVRDKSYTKRVMFSEKLVVEVDEFLFEVCAVNLWVGGAQAAMRAPMFWSKQQPRSRKRLEGVETRRGEEGDVIRKGVV